MNGLGPRGKSPIQILLVEDDPAFAALIGEWLTDIALNSPHLAMTNARMQVCDGLSSAMQHLLEGMFDILLLDLNLPDSVGLETFDRLYQSNPEIPIIILSAMIDESTAIEAVGRGAQDYLVKGRLDGNLLVRAMRYAIERSHLQRELAYTLEEERNRRERQILEKFLSQGGSAISSRMLGLHSLKQGVPELFTEMVNRFGQALERSLETRTHRISFDPSPAMKELAGDLGAMKSGPRDVVDIYLTALDRISGQTNPKRRQILGEEGRLLALELMGYLVSQYRPYVLASPAREPPSEKRR